MAARTGEIFLASCLSGDTAVVSRILKRNRKPWTGLIGAGSGFDINILDKNGRTGLMLACMADHPGIVKMLVDRQELRVNTQDIFRATALMYAARCSLDGECLNLLLGNRSVDLDEKDCDGKSAEDYARAATNTQNQDLLHKTRVERIGGGWSVVGGIGEQEEEEELQEQEDELLQEQEEQEAGAGEHSDSNRSSSSTSTDTEPKPSEVRSDVASPVRALDESFLLDSGSDSDEEDLLQDFGVSMTVKMRENVRLETQRLEDRLDRINTKEEAERSEATARYSQKKAVLDEEYKVNLEKLEMARREEEQAIHQKFSTVKKAIQTNLARLERCSVDLDWDKIVRISGSVSELECPVCLEEMRPPIRIWQCHDGHAICDTCRKRAEVTSCPTCRQDIVGRNTLAEKIASNLFPS